MFLPSRLDARFEDLQTHLSDGPFYEALSLIAASPDADRAIELRLAVAASGPEWAERTIEFSVLAMERDGHAHFAAARYRWSDWTFRRGLRIQGPENKFTPEHCKGSLGPVSWDVLLGGGLGGLPLLPGRERLYRYGAGHMRQYTHASSLKLAGSLQVDGQPWSLEGWQGMRPHAWAEAIPMPSSRLAVHSWHDGVERALEMGVGPLDVGPMLSPDSVQRVVLIGPEKLRWLRMGAPLASLTDLDMRAKGARLQASATELLSVRSLAPHGTFVRQLTPFARVSLSGTVSGGSEAGWLEHFVADTGQDALISPGFEPKMGVFSISR